MHLFVLDRICIMFNNCHTDALIVRRVYASYEIYIIALVYWPNTFCSQNSNELTIIGINNMIHCSPLKHTWTRNSFIRICNIFLYIYDSIDKDQMHLVRILWIIIVLKTNTGIPRDLVHLFCLGFHLLLGLSLLLGFIIIFVTKTSTGIPRDLVHLLLGFL